MKKPEEYVQEFAKMFEAVGVEKDTDWQMNQNTSIPRRGIIDNDRYITFKRELTKDELADVLVYLKEEAWIRQRGYTNNGGYRDRDRHPDTPTYRFHTCWDSSD